MRRDLYIRWATFLLTLQRLQETYNYGIVLKQTEAGNQYSKQFVRKDF